MVRRVIVGRLVMTMRNIRLNVKEVCRQRGVVLIVFVFLIALAATAYLMHTFSPIQLKNKQYNVTLQALAEAKQALMAYHLQNMESSVCKLNCRRPGDFPCPDLDNNGEAETACDASESDRLGRLPWKTLGTNDLRDGTGERLWYAVSNQYINNLRALPDFPLNSQTEGHISLRNNNGVPVNNAVAGSGLVAVVIAPQIPLTRQELGGGETAQNRLSTNLNKPIHYLEVAASEDNADFKDKSTNGFISGVVKVMQNNQMVIISNDTILPIYQSEVADLSKTVVMNEVAKALKNDVDVLPFPSAKNDLTCIGNGLINNSACNADKTSLDGYIPVNKGDDPIFVGWQTKNANSILRGEDANNWFQQNDWRRYVRYQKDAQCATNEKWCRNIDSEITIRMTN